MALRADGKSFWQQSFSATISSFESQSFHQYEWQREEEEEEEDKNKESRQGRERLKVAPWPGLVSSRVRFPPVTCTFCSQ